MLFSQSCIVSGKISDSETGEYLPMATVFCQKLNSGTLSNSYGYYSIKLNKGQVVLEYRYVGYEKQVFMVSATTDTLINIELKPNINIDEVVIEANTNRERIQSSNISCHSISVKNIEKLPSLLGETDILKELRSLPGINSGGEGSAGLIVRGSGPDQNLVLFDGVPIYNINHLGSFFSVFNTDAIASAEIFKGAYPARYGGRISSVIDVRMREGNLKKMEGKISVGTIASKFTLEGPLVKNKASFIVSARRTYLDLLANGAQRMLDPNELTLYNFDDYNLKMNYIVNTNNRIYLSGYLGKDKLSWNTYYTFGESEQYMNWGNKFASVRWNHIVNSKTFANITAYYYRYNYIAGDNFIDKDIEADTIRRYHNNENEISMQDLAFKADFDYSLNTKHAIKYGGQFTYHHFFPNKYNYYAIHPEASGPFDTPPDTINTSFLLGEFKSGEAQLYLEDEWSITGKIKMNMGLQYSALLYKSESHYSLMPRISMVYNPNNFLAFRLATGMYSQYVFLISNPAIGLPTDTWLQSINKLKPMAGWQSVFGIMYNTPTNFLLNFETFFKRTNNVAEFNEMKSFSYFEEWTDVISQGVATNYGFELMAEKSTTNYMLKISYAFTRALMQFDDLNNGEMFYYTFDSPHNINFQGSYNINEKIDVGVTWTYASGKLLTLVEQNYSSYFRFENNPLITMNNQSDGFDQISGYDIATAPERNNHRVSPYHRLDLGVNFKKDKPKGRRIWNFGIYNVYNRKNVFYLEHWGGSYKAQSLTSIVPYVSYSFKF